MTSPGPPILAVPHEAPAIIPVRPFSNRQREGRWLFVVERTVYLNTCCGWIRVPRGYVTDFGSIPGLATLLTLLALQPLGRHAWAALAHDWLYAIGEAGMRDVADRVFLDRMKLDGVSALRRNVMFRAVRWGGAGGYRKAPSWWATENFVDPDAGDYPAAMPFAREDAFSGARWGRRPAPVWGEDA